LDAALLSQAKHHRQIDQRVALGGPERQSLLAEG
jgi:hypothetical protein